MKKYYFLLLPLIAIIYGSCSKLEGPAPTPVTDSTKTLVQISLTDTLTMYVGQEIQFDVKVRPVNYDTTKLVWSSSDTTIISVNSLGKVIAKSEGTSRVSVSNVDNTKSISCLVTVKDSLNIGLIAHYPFDNSADDISGNSNNGSASNLSGDADRFGNANGAYHFNGVNSLILVKDKQTLRLAHTDFTINTWVKMDSYNNSYGTQIIDKRDAGESNGWNLSVTGEDFVETGQGGLGLLTFNEGSSSGLTTLSATKVALNSWHMITTVYDYNVHTLSFYIDGVKDSSFDGFASPNPAVRADVYIGADNPNVSDGYFLNGSLDDMRLYDRALSDSEIARLFKSLK